MKYLLDTNILVDFLRGTKSIEVSIIKESCAISIITYGELIYGAYKSDKKEENLYKIKEMINDLEIEVNTLDEKIMNEYGELKAKLEKKGERLDEFDLLIAATALINNLTLFSRNLKHFKRIPSLSFIS